MSFNTPSTIQVGIKKNQEKFFQVQKKLNALNRKERKEIDCCSIVLFFTSPVRYIFYLENEFANELI